MLSGAGGGWFHRRGARGTQDGFWQNKANWNNATQSTEVPFDAASPAFRRDLATRRAGKVGRTKPRNPVISKGLLTVAPLSYPNTTPPYRVANFGITSVRNSSSERSASASDMVPRKR